MTRSDDCRIRPALCLLQVRAAVPPWATGPPAAHPVRVVATVRATGAAPVRVAASAVAVVATRPPPRAPTSPSSVAVAALAVAVLSKQRRTRRWCCDAGAAASAAHCGMLVWFLTKSRGGVLVLSVVDRQAVQRLTGVT